MLQTILQIQGHCYPFNESFANGRLVRVYDVQSFHSLKDLQQKKNEMLVKMKLINSPYIIKLLKVYQQDLNLHYIYEYVPKSFLSQLRKQTQDQSQKTAFLKRISHELMILVSYLVQIKLEIQLSFQNLGFTEDEKLKLFMNSKCRMGHKTELSLITYYGKRKDTILSIIQKEVPRRNSLAKDKNYCNFSIKENKLIFDQAPMNYSVYQSNNSFDPSNINQTLIHTANQDQIFNSNMSSSSFYKRKPTASCIDKKRDQSSFLRQTQNPQLEKNLRFSQPKNQSKSAQKETNLKAGFNFGINKQKQTKFSIQQDEARSFSHSRSLRIELQQMKSHDKDKKRKDSYKVKITSLHEYEMDDCNPLDLLNKSNGNLDLFQNLLKKAKNCSKSYRDRQADSTEKEEMPSPKKFMRKDSTPQYSYTADISESAQKLGDKVKKAKQQAQLVLNRYMKLKKTLSYNY